ncbi:hypothetical protein [uncultured Pseudoflavonifractor sp.]|nr:hypothetical protein [uncultured Pseudoflavonifractor sp.]
MTARAPASTTRWWAVRCSAPLDEHWKDAIEENFRKRQKKDRQ